MTETQQASTQCLVVQATLDSVLEFKIGRWISSASCLRHLSREALGLLCSAVTSLCVLSRQRGCSAEPVRSVCAATQRRRGTCEVMSG